jgi:TolB-like protein/class 3 adenylate cyclase/Flp pilus assembly protein TadD
MTSPPAVTERRLSAVWFADIVGYSRLASEDEPAAFRLVQCFQRLAREQTAHRGGRLVKFIGDSALAEFGSTEAAVCAALSLRNAFLPESSPSTPAELRIGVHLGDVVSAPDGDLYGNGVNVAARLEKEAEPGQVLVSEDVWHQLRPNPTYRFTALGERMLRGMTVPIAVFDLGLAEGASLPEEAASADLPEGGDTSDGAAAPPRHDSGRARSRRHAAVVGVVLLALAGIGAPAWFLSSAARSRAVTAAPSAASAPRVPSIAVLPFSDLSPGHDSEYFSEGLAEEILDALSRVEGLNVAARTSSFGLRQRGLDMREVGERLRVGSVLEGSVRKAGERLRVNVRLVDVGTGYDLWSEEYELRLDDVFRVQDEITLAVVSALKGRLVEQDSAKVIRTTTPDEQAFDLYLRGHHYWNQRTGVGLQRALELFQRAVARDPNYALAHVGVADVYALLASPEYGVLPPKQAFPLARAELDRALELDPGSAEAHAGLGNVLVMYEHDWPAAEREFHRALELDRGYAPGLHWYAVYLLAIGEPERAIATIRRASEMEPLNVLMRTAHGRVLYFAHRYDASIEAYRSALAMDPGYVNAHLGLGLAYVQERRPAQAVAEYQRVLDLPGGRQPVVTALLAHALAVSGRKAEARARLRELEALSRQRYVPPEYAALVHLGLGEKDAALADLERAYEARSGGLVYLRVEPLFDALRGEPRFTALERRVGL